MRLSVPLRGTGRVEVAAYGVADAEHLVQKELERLWPGARVRVLEVRRAGEEPLIVEEFEVSYRIDVAVEVEAPSSEAAPREAFRLARGRLAGSRYARTSFEAADQR